LRKFKLKVFSVNDLDPFRKALSKVVVFVVNRIFGERIMISREKHNWASPISSALERLCKTTPPLLTWLGTVKQVAGAENNINVVLFCPAKYLVHHAQTVSGQLPRIRFLELLEGEPDVPISGV
jgi:hypothetical protein